MSFHELAQDYILIGMTQSPGRATIVPPGTPRNYDVKPGRGYAGAYVVFTSAGVAKFDVIFHFWDEADSALWDAFATAHLSVSPPGMKPKSIGIYHPVLVKPPLKVDKVYCTDVTGFTQVDDGLWECRASFIEAKDPKPVLVGKPLPGTPAATKPLPTVKDAADAEIAAKLAELNKVMAP